MEKGNTKQEILNVALDLFSTKGYEATSVSQIVEAVGIRKASLYSHFASKHEILEALTQAVFVEYEKHSIFANSNWDDPKFTEDKKDLSPDVAVKIILKHVDYILHDPLIKKTRKMLTIEQFQNADLRALQTKQNYTDVMRYFTGLMKFLIAQGKVSNCDAEIMAAELCLPISVWINLCDREAEREGEVYNLIERHIRQFFELYKAKNC